jgi:MFS family permease
MWVVMLGVGAYHVISVPYLRRTFGLGPEGLGAVDTAHGIGMAVGGVALGFLATRFRKARLAGWSIIIIGGLIALMGLAPAYSLVNLIPSLSVDAEMAEMAVGQRLLYMPLLLLLYSFLFGIAVVPAQSALMTMMQLAVPDQKRGRVGSALNAITTAASLLSMGLAASLGEVVALRLIYVIAGAFVSAGGLVGLLVLREPTPPTQETSPDEAQEASEPLAA